MHTVTYPRHCCRFPHQYPAGRPSGTTQPTERAAAPSRPRHAHSRYSLSGSKHACAAAVRVSAGCACAPVDASLIGTGGACHPGASRFRRSGGCRCRSCPVWAWCCPRRSGGSYLEWAVCARRPGWCGRHLLLWFGAREWCAVREWCAGLCRKLCSLWRCRGTCRPFRMPASTLAF